MNQFLEKAVLDHRLFAIQSSLMGVQKTVIGVFKPHQLKHFELVVEKNENVVRTLHIGSFLGLQDSHYPINLGTYYPLPYGFDNLYDLIQKPYQFKHWTDSFL